LLRNCLKLGDISEFQLLFLRSLASYFIFKTSTDANISSRILWPITPEISTFSPITKFNLLQCRTQSRGLIFKYRCCVFQVVDWSAVEPGIRLAALGGITIHLEGGEGDEGSPPPPPSPESSDVAEDDTNSNSKGVGRYNQEPLFLPLSFELLDPEAGALHDLLDDLELHRKRRRTALAALAEGVGLSSAESGESADEGGGSKSGGGRSKGMLSRARWWKASSPPPRLHQDLLFPMAVMDDGQEEDGDEGSGTGESRDGRN
jgi:uncharacterized membrane protein YgcG